MPSRKRHQEWKKRYRQAAAEIEKEDEEALRLALTDPLDDAFWLAHERGDWCCGDCHPGHPSNILAAATAEIDAYLNRETT